MKRSFLLYVSILAIIGCAQQQTPPPATATATGPITPTSYAAGSPANTTTAFDGTWTGRAIAQHERGQRPARGRREGSASCPNPLPRLNQTPTDSHNSTFKTSGFRDM